MSNTIDTGNWTTGQVFGYLAMWINLSYEFYPPGSGPLWLVKPLLRMKKKLFLRDGMPRGIRIPRVENGTFGTEALSTDEGARRLRQDGRG